MVSAPITTTGTTSVDVDFQWYHGTDGGATTYLTEGVQVQYSLDKTTWIDAGSFVRRYDATAGWSLKNVTLPVGAGNQSTIYVGFLFTSNYGNNCYLDAVVIKPSPSCLVPTALTSSNLTTSSATISWTASTSNPTNGYDIYYSTINTAPVAGTTPSTSVAAGITTVNLSSLTANTTYYFWVRSNCNGIDKSEWAGGNFLTGYCTSTSSGSSYYISNFVTTGGASNISNSSAGWSTTGYGDFTASSTSNYIGASTGFTATWNTTSGVGFGLWIDWNNDMDFADANEAVYVTSSYNFTNSYAGSISIPSGTPNGSYRMRIKIDYNLSLPLSCGTITNGETEDYTFTVITAPACSQQPTLLSSSSITSTSATISWTAASPAPASGYDYYVATTSTAPLVSETPSGNVLATTANLSSLAANTKYYFWVRSNCNGTDKSAWAGSGTFTTACGVVSTFPWTENFEGVTTPNLPNCWIQLNNNADADFWQTYSSYGVGSSKAAGLYTDGNSGVNDDYLILPAFNLTGNQRLIYSVRARSTTEPNDYRVVLSTTGTAASDFSTVLLPLTTVSSTTMTEITPLDLSSYTGNVYIAIHIPSGGLDGYYIYFDNFTIEDIPTCIVPTALASSAITASSATISWTASTSNPTNGYDIYYSTINTAPVAGTTPSTSVAAGITTVNLSSLAANTKYYFWVRSNCNGTDKSAWAGSGTFTTPCANSPLTLTEGFNTTGTSIFPDCWTQQQVTGTSNLTFATSGTSPIVSPQEGTRMVYWNSYSITNGNKTRLVSAPITTTGTTSVDVDFQWYHGTDGGATTYLTEGVQVQYSLDKTTWIDAGSFVKRYAAAAGWSLKNVTLPVAAGNQSTIYVGFLFTSNVGYNSYLDAVVIKPSPSCIVPTALTSSAITASSATISWTASASDPASGYDIYHSTTNTAPTALTPASVSVAAGVTTYNMSGLNANTTYYVWIRSNCGGGDKSSWTSMVQFTTQCGATNVPYSQDFESAIVPGFPNCTSIQNAGTGKDWLTASNPGSGFASKTLKYSYHDFNAANAWFYTQGINLVAGTSYRLTFKYGASGFTEKLKVSYATSPVSTAMTNSIVDYSSITGSTPFESTTDFTPSVSGIYYLGFNCYSDADQFNLFVDDILLDLTFSCPATSTFTGTGNWNLPANWDNGLPCATTDVVINGTGLCTVNSAADCNDITLNPGKSLTVNAAQTLTIHGQMTVKSTALGSGSLVNNGMINYATDSKIERYLAASMWHLVSSPITNALSGVFVDIWLRPYNEATNAFGEYIVPTNIPLPVGQGYSNWTNNNETRTFIGTANNGSVGPISLPRTNLGWSLIGNPYPSAIDWDATSGWTKSNVANSVYVWNNGQYATYNGSVGTEGGTKNIALGQGFFVQALAGGGSIAMNNNVRVHNSVDFMKTVDPANVIRVKVATEDYSDEIVIAIRSNIMDEFDYQFDATKLRGDVLAPQLYTKKADIEAVICAYNELDKVNGKFVYLEPGQYIEHVLIYTHTLDASNVPLLFDHVTGTNIYPNVPFTFVPSTNNMSDRFEFINGSTTGLDNNSNADIMIWESDKVLYVNNLGDEKLQEIKLYDMQGRLVYVGNKAVNQLSHLQTAPYIVHVVTNQQTIIRKLVLK